LRERQSARQREQREARWRREAAFKSPGSAAGSDPRRQSRENGRSGAGRSDCESAGAPGMAEPLTAAAGPMISGVESSPLASTKPVRTAEAGAGGAAASVPGVASVAFAGVGQASAAHAKGGEGALVRGGEASVGASSAADDSAGSGQDTPSGDQPPADPPQETFVFEEKQNPWPDPDDPLVADKCTDDQLAHYRHERAIWERHEDNRRRQAYYEWQVERADREREVRRRRDRAEREAAENEAELLRAQARQRAEAAVPESQRRREESRRRYEESRERRRAERNARYLLL